ncbi:MAG: hypothetical protein H6622_11925 [Halobacteriovoraceae bacterium]|nr:hypothetical protein [Halobacteriovoraceae bacterium]
MKKIFLFLVFFPQYVFATKSCAPSPCIQNGKFNSSKCALISKWVAVGEIKNIKHNKKGFPENTDFAEFDFQIELTEKGKIEGTNTLKFKIGWCKNVGPIPREVEGRLFRFYGKDETEYFYFQEFKI